MKSNRPFILFTAVGMVFLVFILLCSCQRSPAFHRDQGYNRPEPTTYYNKSAAGKAPTQRIEAMGQPKKRVLVFNFWNDTPAKTGDFGLFASDELRRGLYATQRVILSPELKSDFTTEDFIQGDKVKVAQLIREGRRLGVSVLVIGRVTKVVFRQRGDEVGLFRQKQSLAAVDIEMKVFDVAGGREVLAAGRSGESSSNALVVVDASSNEGQEQRAELTQMAIRNAVAVLVPEVVKGIEKMAWEGRIAKIVGSKVYVNAGKSSGLMVGDILKVLAPGDDIYDPASSAYLGRTPGQLKGTLEVQDFIGTDAAMTEIHTGSNFAEGDAVQLY